MINIKKLANSLLKTSDKECCKVGFTDEQASVFMLAIKGEPQTRTCSTPGCVNPSHYKSSEKVFQGDIEDILEISQTNPALNWTEIAEMCPHIKPLLVAGILYINNRREHFTEYDIRYFRKLK